MCSRAGSGSTGSTRARSSYPQCWPCSHLDLLAHSLTTDDPFLDLRLLLNRNLTVGYICTPSSACSPSHRWCSRWSKAVKRRRGSRLHRPNPRLRRFGRPVTKGLATHAAASFGEGLAGPTPAEADHKVNDETIRRIREESHIRVEGQGRRRSFAGWCAVATLASGISSRGARRPRRSAAGRAGSSRARSRPAGERGPTETLIPIGVMPSNRAWMRLSSAFRPVCRSPYRFSRWRRRRSPRLPPRRRRPTSRWARPRRRSSRRRTRSCAANTRSRRSAS